jgi:hypothetical protein
VCCSLPGTAFDAWEHALTEVPKLAVVAGEQACCSSSSSPQRNMSSTLLDTPLAAARCGCCLAVTIFSMLAVVAGKGQLRAALLDLPPFPLTQLGLDSSSVPPWPAAAAPPAVGPGAQVAEGLAGLEAPPARQGSPELWRSYQLLSFLAHVRQQDMVQGAGHTCQPTPAQLPSPVP